MNFAKAMVLLAFVAVFAAGGVCGMFVKTLAPAPAPPPQSRPQQPRSWLKDKLDLTPDQEAKMKEYYDAFREHNGQREQARRQLGQQRDKEIQALMATPELKARYDEIIARHDAAVQKLREEGSAEGKATDEKTKSLLNPEQLKKYEDLIKEREARGPRGNGPGSHPSSRPFGGGRGGPPPDGMGPPPGMGGH